jgi:hypothetical protein
VKGYKSISGVIGCALALISTICALNAPAAFATQFHSEVTPTALSGSQATENVLSFPNIGWSMSCSSVSLAGEVNGTTTVNELTLTPSYSGCNVSGLPADVKMNGCDYKFRIESGGSGFGFGFFDLGCPKEKQMEITATSFGVSICTVTMAPQIVFRSTMKFTTQGSGSSRDVLMNFNLGGLEYAIDNEGCSNFSGENGTHSGTITLKGFKPFGGTQVGIWIE